MLCYLVQIICYLKLIKLFENTFFNVINQIKFNKQKLKFVTKITNYIIQQFAKYYIYIYT